MPKSNYYTCYSEEYSLQDIIEMGGVEEIVTEHADKHRPDGDLGNYELELVVKGHLAVVNFVRSRHQ